jgi:hypothetical protein
MPGNCLIHTEMAGIWRADMAAVIDRRYRKNKDGRGSDGSSAGDFSVGGDFSCGTGRGWHNFGLLAERTN